VEALFKSCMQQDPKLRPTAKEAIRTLASLMSIEPALSTVVDPAPLEDQEVPQRCASGRTRVPPLPHMCLATWPFCSCFEAGFPSVVDPAPLEDQEGPQRWAFPPLPCYMLLPTWPFCPILRPLFPL
jgi:hypothetical protein